MATFQEQRDNEYLRQMKEDFDETKDNLDERSSRLIESIRESLLNTNQNGEFVQLGISPSILTDDFVMQVSNFMKLYSLESQPHVVVGYWVKHEGSIKNSWLQVRLAKMSDSDESIIEYFPGSLALLRFPSKNAEADFFAKLLDEAVKVLKEEFPVVTKRNPNMEHHSSPKIRHGQELAAALHRAQELRERGALRKVPFATHAVVELTESMDSSNHEGLPVAKEVDSDKSIVYANLCRKDAQPMSLLLKALLLAACFYVLRAWFA